MLKTSLGGSSKNSSMKEKLPVGKQTERLGGVLYEQSVLLLTKNNNNRDKLYQSVTLRN